MMSPLVTIGTGKRHYYAGSSARIQGWVDLRCYQRGAAAQIVRPAPGVTPDCRLCLRLGPVEVTR